MNCCDALRHRGHADNVGSHHPQHPVFGPRLQIRSGNGDQHAFMSRYAKFQSDPAGLFDQAVDPRADSCQEIAAPGGRH